MGPRLAAYDPWKRCLDLSLATSALVVLSPLLVLCAALLRLTSGSGVLYRARRAGVDGQPFDVLKFRTMVHGADAASSVTVGTDARVTRLGKVLRATKIDELPQLWNVVVGQMSVVGPRPESMEIVDAYYREEDRELLSIRPGLTCSGSLLFYVFHAQLEPPAEMSTETFYHQHLLRPKLLADLHYVRNRNLGYDFDLILSTLRIMFCKLFALTPKWEPKFASQPPAGWRGDALTRAACTR